MEISGSVSSIATLATSMSKDKLEGEVGVAVLKKAIDLQKESATQLIQALPTPAPAASGSVGSNIDVKA